MKSLTFTGKGQVTVLTVPLHKFSDCNGGFMTGECLGDDRIFVHYMFGGTKNSSYGCPESKNTSYPETCCTRSGTVNSVTCPFPK
jgi:hypothetical protein